jgi:hypothetical protein
MEILIGWVGLAFVVAIFAAKRERSGIGWFFLALLISPLLAGLLLLALGSGTVQVRCPACRELVRSDALKCKHCGEALGAVREVSKAETQELAAYHRENNRKVLIMVVGVAVLFTVAMISANAGTRSTEVVRQFKAQQPCPATGQPSGPCPGWQIDHREALVCGGRDDLANLQWLTVEEHKAKTRVEVKLCRTRVR